MAEWGSQPLKTLVEAGRSICYGIVQPGSHDDQGIPIVRVNNFSGHSLNTSDPLKVSRSVEENYARSRLKGGELLVTLVGSLGQTAIAPPELAGWNVARAVGVIPLAPEADVRWVDFVLRSKPSQEFMASRANTTVQATFNLKDLAELPIPLPPDVFRIPASNLLAALDDRIELNRRMNETLEGMAQAIFRDWFVDFGPVRRKMAGESDPVAILGGLISDPTKAATLAALFPDTLGEDGLPVGWASRPFSEIVSIIGGGTPKTSVDLYWNGDIPWFSVTDTPGGKDLFVFETEKTITQEGVSNSSARLVPRGTTIISARGTVGNLALAGREMAFNQSCYALASAQSQRPYLTYLSASHLVESLKSMSHGSVFSTITRQTFDGVNFVDAGMSVCDAFEATITPIFERIAASVQENQTLAETRDYLLPRLMSGKVRVADAERMVGA